MIGRTVSPFITTPTVTGTVTVGDYNMMWTRRILELGCGPAGLWQSHGGPLRKCSSCDAAATPEIFPPSSGSESATRSWPQAAAVPVATKGPGRRREVAKTQNYQLARPVRRLGQSLSAATGIGPPSQPEPRRRPGSDSCLAARARASDLPPPGPAAKVR